MNLTELYISDINNNPTNKINLIGDSVRELANGGVFWNMTTPPPNSNLPLVEAIPTGLLGEDIGVTKAKLDTLASDIVRFNTNRLRKVSYWLYFRYKDSPYLLRDLIINIQWSSLGANDNYLIDDMLQGTLNITRRGTWERVVLTEHVADEVPTAGGFTIIPNTGSDNGRIAILSIDTPASTEPTNENSVNEYWLGIREELQGFEGFNPVIPLSLGRAENGLDLGTGVLNMATPDLLRRFRISIDELNSLNPSSYVGRYVVLLKQNPTDNNVVYQLKYGNRANDVDKSPFRRVYNVNNPVGAMSWVNLGEVEIPSGNNRIGSITDIRNTELEVWIGRTTGSGSVTLSQNPILLVPSLHFLYIKSENIATTGSTTLTFRTHEDNTDSYELRLSTGEVLNGVPNPRYFKLPYEGGLLVYTSQRNGIAEDTGTELSNIIIQYYSRWLSYANRTYNIIQSNC